MLRKSVFVLLMLVSPLAVLAQSTGKLAGVVTDAETGEPLPGVNVVLEGTTLGTATDIDGDVRPTVDGTPDYAGADVP